MQRMFRRCVRQPLLACLAGADRASKTMTGRSFADFQLAIRRTGGQIGPHPPPTPIEESRAQEVTAFLRTLTNPGDDPDQSIRSWGS